MKEGGISQGKTHGRDGRAPFRVLAVRGGALGDFILTLPALRALLQAGHEVELLTRPAYGHLAQDAGMVSGWRSLEAREAASLMMADAEVDAGWRDWLSGFDAVVSWLPDADEAFREQISLCGVKQFHQGDWRCSGRGTAAGQLAEAVAFTGSMIHPIRDLFRRTLSIDPVTPEQIAFHPGSGSRSKNWPLERWVKVMGSLMETNPEIPWLVITGEVEEERLTDITGAMDQVGLRWESAHALDLTTLSHRLCQCRVLLGHDSGIGHLAAACGLPCRLLFGPTDLAVWAPMGDDVEVISARGGDLNHLYPDEVIDWLRRKPWGR